MATAEVTKDGSKVVFNRRLERPPTEFDTEQYRRVVCVAEVP